MKSFTLIETLIAIFIFIILLGTISAFIISAYKSYYLTIDQSRAIDEARRGIETMIKEIREASQAEDGSYLIEKAGDKEFIFYSDIDGDDKTERVRYFLGSVSSGKEIKECVSFISGGSCSVVFNDFLTGELESAQIKVSLEGDFGWWREFADIYIDNNNFGRVCKTGCQDCSGDWQGTTIFEITELSKDNNLQIVADSSPWVNPFCDWQEKNHSMKALFELSFSETLSGKEHQLKKGVIKPTGSPPEYLLNQEEIIILTNFVRNPAPIFEYFDKNGQKISLMPARLVDTRTMKIKLIIDVDPEKPPSPFEIESSVKIRNIPIE
jgi:type II secretory pathway pseudopilin PulG